MKWESAPLWPVALPSITGFLLSLIPYLFEFEYFSKRNLLAPVLILITLGLFLTLLPNKYGNKFELYLGYVVGLSASYFQNLLWVLWNCRCSPCLDGAINIYVAV